MSGKRRRLGDNFSSLAHGSLEHLRDYLQHAGVADLKNAHGFSLLHAAVQDNEVDKVKLLIQHDCNIDAVDIRGCTPIELAVINKHNSVLETLLEAKANVNTVSYQRITPLLHAILDYNVAAVKLILTKGHNCDVNMDSQFLKNECLFKPLAKAIDMRSTEMCELLLENGARLIDYRYEVLHHVCGDLALKKVFLKYMDELNLPYYLEDVVCLGKLELAEIILAKFYNPFQMSVLGWILRGTFVSVCVRLVKFVVKPYRLATKCSLENKLLYTVLDCNYSESKLFSQLQKRVEIVRVLIDHGLVIHCQTIHRFCRNREKDSACEKCLTTALQISDTGDVASLKSQCCSVIRQNLHSDCRGMFDFEEVESLPLPGTLIDFIGMKDW